MTERMIQSSTFGKARKFFYYLEVFIKRLFRGLKVISIAGKFDVIFLQRATFAFGMERLLRLINKNIIFDIDDSIYMPDTHEKGPLGLLKRYLKQKEVVSILRVSRCAIVENTHIKNFVGKYCNKTYMITGPIDTKRNYPRRYDGRVAKTIIGWIGSPSTAIYLGLIHEALKEVSRKYDIKVKLIGIAGYDIEGVDVEAIGWGEDTEVKELHTVDIGVMPMPDNEWTRGKVGCKMLQYMANAIPAVVSYTPTNAEIIKDGVNGFLAASEKEWVQKLSLLIEDRPLIERVGLEGRRMADANFSLEANWPKFLSVLKSNS